MIITWKEIKKRFHNKDSQKGYPFFITKERILMMIEKININQLHTAQYNPRIPLEPGMPEYEKLKRSIEEFGIVEPIIWNKKTGNVVGGHQRLKILLDKGKKEIECSVVELEEKDEKILNIILNKVKGRWDIGKLTNALQELEEAIALTGFENWELESLITQYDHINDLLEKDFSAYSEENQNTTFTITFTIPEEEKENIDKYFKNNKNAKKELSAAIIANIRGVMTCKS